MAYKNLVITPPKYANQDTTKSSQFYRGFSTQDNTTRSVTLYDTELIKQDLINQLSTVKGERLMNPEFGTIIWNLIYDPLTDDLKEQIQEDIDRILASDPRINPIKVFLLEKDYGLLIEASLTYADSNQVDNIKFSFDKEIGLSVSQ
jgi:phage baseplate assembly protein W